MIIGTPAVWKILSVGTVALLQYPPTDAAILFPTSVLAPVTALPGSQASSLISNWIFRPSTPPSALASATASLAAAAMPVPEGELRPVRGYRAPIRTGSGLAVGFEASQAVRPPDTRSTAVRTSVALRTLRPSAQKRPA